MGLEPKTPQEIWEYKRRALQNSVPINVNIDFWYEGVWYCQENFKKWQWEGKRFAHPDDSHDFVFETEELAERFKIYYDNRMKSIENGKHTRA